MLRRDGHERHALVARGDHARQQVRRAGAGVAEHRSHFARRLVDPLGHVGRGSLVADRYEAQTVPFQRRQQWIQHGTGKPEHEADALGCQAPRQQPAPGDRRHDRPPDRLQMSCRL
jgi:hypothetical protein